MSLKLSLGELSQHLIGLPESLAFVLPLWAQPTARRGLLEAEVLSYLLLVSGRFTHWETPVGRTGGREWKFLFRTLGLLGYLGLSPAGQSLSPDS